MSKIRRVNGDSSVVGGKRARSTFEFPQIDLKPYLTGGDQKEIDASCTLIADCLYKYGLLIVKDPRVTFDDNNRFIDMVESYYERSNDEKQAEVRKDLHYQLGYTPEGVEKARPHCSTFKDFEGEDRPVTLCPPGVDPKCRYFWRVGERPAKTEFKELNAEQVVPKGIKGWSEGMDKWGGMLLAACRTVAEMAALGFGLKKDAFENRMNFAPHLLAPTGSNLYKFGKKGTVFASFHYDLNFLTIHGKSRFPGLYVWTRDGTKYPVKVPDGCLLLQAGKQFEYITGGYVLAGFHEVVVTDKTLAAIEKTKKAGGSLWRVSSTLFSHMASDSVLEPMSHFVAPVSKKAVTEKYPPVKAGAQVQAELDAIKLGRGIPLDNEERKE